MKRATPVAEACPLLICSGQFFVISENEVTVHLLNAEQLKAFYERDSIASNAVNVQACRAQTLRLTFKHADALLALPVSSAEALLYYVEHYDGPQSQTVKQLSACILTGKPFGPQDDSGPPGGAHDRMPVQPKGPRAPAGSVPAGVATAA